MKKYFYLATALVALAACSNEEYVGDNSPTLGENDGAIVFNSTTGNTTRATVGGILAAQKLNNNFVVEGTKTVSASVSEVFDNYNVNFTENSSETSTSNTANWKYVGLTKHANSAIFGTQTIKYWDFAASQYDFWAYSVGTGGATVTALGPDNSTLSSSAYTITGTKSDMEKVYISDLVTTYHTSSSLVDYKSNAVPKIGNQVNLSFRSLMAKIRFGIYETIPGYSVKSVQFFPSESGEPTATPALYATGSVLPAFATTDPYKATFKVYFPHITSSNVTDPDYNVAHVAQTTSDKASNVTFSALTYGTKERNEQTAGTNNWLARSSAEPTWAGDGSYSTILPYETGEVLTLKVNYTLESIDGTGETIVVKNATAIIPANFTKWKANFAYTYIFKISDNTNGRTDPSVSKDGLYPITFDAVVVSDEDGTQESITTVASPSITTYSVTSDVTTANEYKTTDDIYVSVTSDGSYRSLTSKATLYDITKTEAAYAATEAEVHDALTKYTALATGTYTGRNSVKLTPVTGGLNLSVTSVPLVDDNTMTVTAGDVALIDKTKLTANRYYAFVYEITAPVGEPTAKYDYTTVDTSEFVAGTTDVSSYYTTEDGITYTIATGTYVAGTEYYQRHTYSETNGTYGVKVIKVVAGS